jgi:hypothetical protein
MFGEKVKVIGNLLLKNIANWEKQIWDEESRKHEYYINDQKVKDT